MTVGPAVETLRFLNIANADTRFDEGGAIEPSSCVVRTSAAVPLEAPFLEAALALGAAVFAVAGFFAGVFFVIFFSIISDCPKRHCSILEGTYTGPRPSPFPGTRPSR